MENSVAEMRWAPCDFFSDGAEHYAGAAGECLRELEQILSQVKPDQAGVRLHGLNALRPLLAPEGAIGKIAAGKLGSDSRAVRAILFDKSAEANWSLGWHQDRTICVQRRIEVVGFGPWTRKAGLLHVAPPFDLLARMATLRVHLDDTPDDNAPLLIAPGSHRLGLVRTEAIGDAVSRCGVRACLADAGDVWLYATPILHASEAAKSPKRRRVLQIDFAAFPLPGGLEWLGV